MRPFNLRRVCGLAVCAWGLACSDQGAKPSDTDQGATEDTDQVDAASVAPTRRALRHLSRAEYNRTVADLTGTRLQPANDFPADDVTDGFDVVAEGLSLSPLLIEAYDQAAAALAGEIVDRPLDAALDVTLSPVGRDVTVESADHAAVGGTMALFTAGALRVPYDVLENGSYVVSARVWTDLAGGVSTPALFGTTESGPRRFAVTATSAATAEWIQVGLRLTRGRAQLELALESDAVDASADRTLYVDALRVQGPSDLAVRTNTPHDRVMSCDPELDPDPRACAQEVLTAFVPRAWRRPVEPSEIDRLLEVFDTVIADGDPPRLAMDYALRAVLSSPYFVMLVAPAPVGDGSSPVVDDFTLASRLSYLLWSSMPDDELFGLAERGELHQPDVLGAQVERMMRSEKASAMAEDFAGQWLLGRAVDRAGPDSIIYPRFDESVRASMKESMRLSFMDRLRAAAPVTDLLLSTRMQVDGALAPLIGIDLPPFEPFADRDVSAEGRYGWLSMPGLLTVTSVPTRTSPVRRGAWVLSNLMCTSPGTPPPGVPGFPDASPDAATVRERLEQHRQDPACASCHDAIDPLGLALENFDGIGAWRDQDNGEPIDASGQLPNGTAVNGAADLAHVLGSDPTFGRCVVKKLFTYTHGRAPDDADRARLNLLTDGALAGQASFSDILVRLVTDDAFMQVGVER